MDECSTSTLLCLHLPMNVMGELNQGRYAVYVGPAKPYFPTPPHCYRKRGELDQDLTEARLRELVANVLRAPCAAGRLPELWSCRHNMAAKPVWHLLNCTYFVLSYDTKWESCDNLEISSTNWEMPSRRLQLGMGFGFCKNSKGKRFRWHSYL